MAAVSGMHRFQAGCARLPTHAWSGATGPVSFWHPARYRFQPSPSPVVVILTAGDPTYTAVHCRRFPLAVSRLWNSLPRLIVPATRFSTLGDRAFPVAAARVWNALAHSVSSASSLPTFRRTFKDTSFPTQFLVLVLLLFNIFVQCSWSGFHCDSVTLILSFDDDDDNDDDDDLKSTDAVLRCRSRGLAAKTTSEWNTESDIERPMMRSCRNTAEHRENAPMKGNEWQDTRLFCASCLDLPLIRLRSNSKLSGYPWKIYTVGLEQRSPTCSGVTRGGRGPTAPGYTFQGVDTRTKKCGRIHKE